MLSICIPVYNSDVTELITALCNQAEQIEFPIEICVIDDASTHLNYDPSIFQYPIVSYQRNLENVGRSKIRNQFIDIATYSYLLFLDGDSRILRPDFLETYCTILKSSKVEVLCGASVYQTSIPDRSHYLRWKYSTVRESKSLKERLQNPNFGFKTNNFIIHKDIFSRVKFNETLFGYGHEDSLFGFELKKANIRIEHVDNPVLNYILDDNHTFLEKTKNGVVNLMYVLQITNNDKAFIKSSKLSGVFFWLKKYRLSQLVYVLLGVVHPINRFFLTKGYFILPMFDLYKLTLMLQRK